MKKFLSILAAVGLTATASTSVVSCTKKYSQPVYHGLSSLKQNYTTKESMVSDIYIKNISGIQQEIVGTRASADFNNAQGGKNSKGEDITFLKSDLLLANIANTFSNPQDFLSKKDDYAFVLVNPDGVQIPNEKNNYVIASFSLAQKNEINGKSYLSFSKSFNVRIGYTEWANSSKIKPLKDVSVAKMQINLINSESSYYLTAFTQLINNMSLMYSTKQDRINYLDTQVKGKILGKLDDTLFNDLDTSLKNEGYIPGISTDGLRFDSVAQQLKMNYSTKGKNEQINTKFEEWNKKAISFNQAIIDYIKANYIDMNGTVSPLNLTSVFPISGDINADVKEANVKSESFIAMLNDALENTFNTGGNDGNNINIVFSYATANKDLEN